MRRGSSTILWDLFGGRPVPGRQRMTDTRGHVAELLAQAVNEAALDSVPRADEKERVLDMLRSYGDLDADDLYKGSTRGGSRSQRVHAGLDGGEANDPLDFREILEADFWQYKLHFDDFLNQNPTLLQPAGGMDAITNALAGRVGDSIRYRMSTLTNGDDTFLGLFDGFTEGSGAQGSFRVISFQSRAFSIQHRWTLGSRLPRAWAL